MLKYVLLAGAMIASQPALAQDKPGTSTTAPVPSETPNAEPQTAPADQAPIAPAAPTTATPQTAPDQIAQPQTTVQADATAPADAAAKPADSTAQVAQVVDQEFPTYDKDANGKLSQNEFGSWMTALRSAADASTKADSPEMTKWVGTAFAQADVDKDKAISKVELTTFLSQGKS